MRSRANQYQADNYCLMPAIIILIICRSTFAETHQICRCSADPIGPWGMHCTHRALSSSPFAISDHQALQSYGGDALDKVTREHAICTGQGIKQTSQTAYACLSCLISVAVTSSHAKLLHRLLQSGPKVNWCHTGECERLQAARQPGAEGSWQLQQVEAGKGELLQCRSLLEDVPIRLEH